MTWLDFIVRMADALAWPFVVLVIVIVLRRPIARVLAQGPLKRIKAAGFELEWDRIAAETVNEVKAIDGPQVEVGPLDRSVEEDLAPEAEGAPVVAVLRAYATVEGELRSILDGVETPQKSSRMGGVGLARVAAQHRLISSASVRAVEGISVLRNLVAYGGTGDLTPEQAREYLALADGALYAIRSDYGKAKGPE